MEITFCPAPPAERGSPGTVPGSKWINNQLCKHGYSLTMVVLGEACRKRSTRDQEAWSPGCVGSSTHRADI